MRFTETPLSGSYVIETEPFCDERGLFARTFCQKEFARIGFDGPVVQINSSVTSKRGSIRGMHYQCPPACEIKIIRCVRGAVFDVMVDIRAGSPTFMQWYGVEMSKDNMHIVYIPKGFAHGFQTLSDDTELIYHHSEFYSPEYERGLRYDDTALAINWPLPAVAVSDRDRGHPLIGSDFKGIEI